MPGRRPQSGFATPDEIFDDIEQTCRAFPGAKRLRLFCLADRPHALSCFIDVDIDHAADIARAFGTLAFRNTVVPRIDILAGFTCPNRVEGRMLLKSCDRCIRRLDPPCNGVGS